MNLRTDKIINVFLLISQSGDPEVKTRQLTLILGFKLCNNLFLGSLLYGTFEKGNALHFRKEHRNCNFGLE